MKNDTETNTLDGFLYKTIVALRELGYSDSEIVAMIEETTGDVYRRASVEL